MPCNCHHSCDCHQEAAIQRDRQELRRRNEESADRAQRWRDNEPRYPHDDMWIGDSFYPASSGDDGDE